MKLTNVNDDLRDPSDTSSAQQINGSLFHSSIKIGKTLAKHGQATLNAKGYCMYPNVRPGDLLHIQACPIDDVNIGDIAICRCPGYLRGHRVIDKGVEDGHSFILTRSDNATDWIDLPTYEEDLLGIVGTIERKGRLLSPRPKPDMWSSRTWRRMSVTFIITVQRMRESLVILFHHLQKNPIYQRPATLWLSHVKRHRSYVVRLPLRAGQSHDLYHPLTPDEFKLIKSTWQGHALDRWTLALHLNEKSTPAALADFTLYPSGHVPPDWHLTGLQVRVRYRGCGLCNDIINKADEIFSRNGSTFHRMQK